MGFFDTVKEGAGVFGSKVSDVAKTVANKTGEAVEEARIKSKISSEKNAASKIKKEIGELIWSKYSAGEVLSEDLAILCENIKTHEDKIAELKAELNPEAAKDVEAEIEAETETEEVTED